MFRLLNESLNESARSLPDKIAIQHEDGAQLTYRELAALSDRWAWHLAAIKRGRRHDHPYVGVLAPVNPWSIAAVIGILKAGFAYVPLDERAPAARARTIVDQAGIDVLVAEPALLERYRELCDADSLRDVVECKDAVSPRLDPGLAHDREVLADPGTLSDDLAYVLYTSGSTGVPKGILLTHRAACAFVAWMQAEFALTPDDVVMSRAPFRFDLSVFDVFNTLTAGGTVITYDWLKRRPGDARHRDYVDLMVSAGATILYTTPSTFVTLIHHGGLGENRTGLRTVMYAGEPFPKTQLRELARACPQTRIANIYGPTETNIITYHWVDQATLADDGPVPIGREVTDIEILVVGDDGRLCAPGEVGELWCRGAQVTSGYLGSPEQTRAQLVQSRFHPYPAWFWRTGDRALRDDVGVLHYRGRRDHMVKVSGYRVELGDIEAAAAAHPAVEACTVVAVTEGDAFTGTQLHGYYTTVPGSCLSSQDLREHLAGALPPYMVPRGLWPLDATPLTSSGKADRTLLAGMAKGMAHA